jgi:DNA-binding LytR/AlgR family response regulator
MQIVGEFCDGPSALDAVREAQPWSKGTWILLTRGGLQIPVGEQYRDALRKILE